MKITNISSINDIKPLLTKIDVDGGGVSILNKKSKQYIFYIKNLHVGAANILKQDALSLGADLAVPSGTILCETKEVDAILMGSRRVLEQLATKELAQPFGLKNLSKFLKNFFSNDKNHELKIMGVLNANDDSFYSESRFDAQNAKEKIESMIVQGADIIDIGAVSSRPGSDGVSDEEEISRLLDIFKTIKENNLNEKVKFSIDSYSPLVIEKALNSGFEIVNDITGLVNDEVAKLVAKYKAKVVIMHMQGSPKDMQDNPNYEDVIDEVDSFFEERISKAESFGIAREDIILDVGIGFGKRLEDNLALLQHQSHFKHFGCEILIGASRKSFINAIYPSETSERLPGTLATHLSAIERGASIVRCHDVAEHKQAIDIHQAINNQLI